MTKLKSDLIETIVCIPMSKLKTEPMDNSLSEILMRLLMSNGNISIPLEQKPFLYQVIEKRIDHCFTFTINDTRLLLFLCAISETPGTAMLYLWYIQYWCNKNNFQVIDLETFCEKLFPMGFFSKKDLSTIWDNQKNNDGGNIVDFVSAGESIMNLKP